jgi:hypothetical protein
VEHLGHGKLSDEFATPGVDLPLRLSVRCVILAIGLGAAAGVKLARQGFFSEEKNQKTFIPRLAAIVRPNLDRGTGERTKVSCFFSSEKKILP